MSVVVVNGSDPDIYLTNGTRESLGLVGESTRPQSIVQAAQDGYFAATGAWPYVQGMSNTPGKPPEPPKPIPPLGITAAVTKAPSTTPDDTGVITISGSKATHGATFNYIFKMDGRVQTPKSVAITTGMTAIQVATAVVDQFTDPDVTVSRSGGALTFAPESGSFLAKLTVAIS